MINEPRDSAARFDACLTARADESEKSTGTKMRRGLTRTRRLWLDDFALTFLFSHSSFSGRNDSYRHLCMHDGQTSTLEAVVELHNKGGIHNPDLDAQIKPLGLTDTEKKDLLAFLKALTGPEPVIKAPKLP